METISKSEALNPILGTVALKLRDSLKENRELLQSVVTEIDEKISKFGSIVYGKSVHTDKYGNVCEMDNILTINILGNTYKCCVPSLEEIQRSEQRLLDAIKFFDTLYKTCTKGAKYMNEPLRHGGSNFNLIENTIDNIVSAKEANNKKMYNMFLSELAKLSKQHKHLEKDYAFENEHFNGKDLKKALLLEVGEHCVSQAHKEIIIREARKAKDTIWELQESEIYCKDSYNHRKTIFKIIGRNKRLDVYFFTIAEGTRKQIYDFIATQNKVVGADIDTLNNDFGMSEQQLCDVVGIDYVTFNKDVTYDITENYIKLKELTMKLKDTFGKIPNGYNLEYDWLHQQNNVVHLLKRDFQSFESELDIIGAKIKSELLVEQD